jgi:hypothetical protein
MTIWKYPVPLDTPGAVFHLKMPVGAEVLTVQLQQGKPTIWALLDPDARMIQRSFRIVGTGLTLVDRLQAFLEARPNEWVDGLALAQIAGAYAWRTRLSDLRQRGLVIENRVRRVEKRFKVSEYRLVVRQVGQQLKRAMTRPVNPCVCDGPSGLTGQTLVDASSR